MKRFTNIFGIITALFTFIGGFTKAQHYAGGASFLILSVGLLIPVYLLCLTIVTYKERKVIAPLIITGFFLLFFLWGILFLLMHWPGGSAISFLMFLPTIFCLFGFAIIYMTKKKEEQTLNPSVIICAIILISLLYGTIFRTTTKGTFVGHLVSADNGRIILGLLTEKNNSLIAATDSIDANTAEIHDQTTSLVKYIEEQKKQVCTAIGSENGIPGNYEDLDRIDDTDIAYYTINGHGQLSELKSMMLNLKNKYKTLSLPQSESGKIEKTLTLKDYENLSYGKSWEEFYFENTPAIAIISTLTSLQNKLLLAENIVLTNRLKKQ